MCHEASEAFYFSSQDSDHKEMSNLIVSIPLYIALFRFAPI